MVVMKAVVFVKIVVITRKALTVINVKIDSIVLMENTGMKLMFVHVRILHFT